MAFSKSQRDFNFSPSLYNAAKGSTHGAPLPGEILPRIDWLMYSLALCTAKRKDTPRASFAAIAEENTQPVP